MGVRGVAWVLPLLAFGIPSCDTFQSSYAPEALRLAARNSAIHSAQCTSSLPNKGVVWVPVPGSSSLGLRGAPRSGCLTLAAKVGGREEADDFDSVTGYTDMTGVARFDEAWEAAYRRKDGIRCPFWRRRTVDALEMLLNVARFVVSRHKSLDVTPVLSTGTKSEGMTIAQVAEVVRADFEERQYYVTGRLSKRVYADDCFFDAPDPDMPVKGLRKYVDAISHLFETRKSTVDLLDMQLLPDRNAILARWRLEGTLMLPWRPAVRAYTGVTLYELNEVGLVYRHTELWSQHVIVAFLSAVLSVDDPLTQRALGLVGVPVSPPAPPVEEIQKLPVGERAPDPAPLLTRGGRGPLASLGGALGLLGRKRSVG